MFGSILLDTRLALAVILLLALLEALGMVLLSRWVPWSAPARGRGAFFRQRVSLAVVFCAGIILYHYFKEIYIYDPFFFSLYTFLISFSLFYYLTSLAAVITTVAAGEAYSPGPSPDIYLMGTLVLLMVALARPQVSNFGFFSGCAAHVLGRFSGDRMLKGRARVLLILALGALLMLFLTYFSS
jgi:hypothetical protein